ncbi:hypothetical protein AHiyo8_44920 [Arthrobacter sp. Hiyo8]|nr:hypothetical protein AHiyo8_44920 [Arthrobacter sp. Hiyo8]
MNTSGVVGPRDAEDDLALRFAQALKDSALEEFRVPVMYRAKAFEDLGDGLVKFQLARVPRQDGVPDCFQPRIHVTPYNFCAERRI